ncbi:MAG: trimethylamine methyltransferase family protein [Thermodesulfobacteriota bacterium]
MALVSPKLEVISRNQMSRLHEASLDILQNVGVVFHSEAARQLFKKHGARVDGELVHLADDLVNKALETSPSTYRHGARNPRQDILVGHRQKKHVFSGIYGPVYVLDPVDGRRPGVMTDYINFIKLFQAMDIVTVVGGLQVEPSDADPRKKFFQMLYQIIRNTDKALWGFPGSRKDILNMFRMVSLALGRPEGPLDRPVIGTAVCPLSPLRFTLEHADTILTYAEQQQPVYINSCIMAGVSGPVSLLGTAALMNAEILAGVVLTQLANPGAPVVYVPGATVADLKHGVYTGGGPESNLIVIAGLQMALDLYKLPTRVMGGLSDAKEVDYQAGAETMQNLLMPLLAGAHFLNNALGNLDGQLTTSFEKCILDLEAIERVLRVLKGVEGYDEEPALDLIKEMGHQGQYLMHRNTFDHYRRRWRPSVSNWDDYQRWQRLGAPDLAAKAERIRRDILAAAPETLLEPEIDRDLRKFVEKVEPAGSE